MWNELLDTAWLNGTVRDQVFWSYTTIPLPYHIHAFQVGQIVPYLVSNCLVKESMCIMDAYKDYCFTQLDTVLGESSVSQDAFIAQWTA